MDGLNTRMWASWIQMSAQMIEYQFGPAQIRTQNGSAYKERSRAKHERMHLTETRSCSAAGKSGGLKRHNGSSIHR